MGFVYACENDRDGTSGVPLSRNMDFIYRHEREQIFLGALARIQIGVFIYLSLRIDMIYH